MTITHGYIERQLDKELLKWKNDTFRKPLLLRGAGSFHICVPFFIH